MKQQKKQITFTETKTQKKMKTYTCTYICEDGDILIEPIEAENKQEARYIMQGFYPMLITNRSKITCKEQK